MSVQTNKDFNREDTLGETTSKIIDKSHKKPDNFLLGFWVVVISIFLIYGVMALVMVIGG